MSKGLKGAVRDALATETTAPTPVQVSSEALRSLTTYLRDWSGWSDARLKMGNPLSPWASTDHPTRTFSINIDPLVLNPNRVLLNVTPFRLRQEAVLTGTLLHEAGHARHTKWRARTMEELAALTHGDGSPVNQMTYQLATLMEEPRVEGLMAAEAERIGARGLEWTMRASAAHLLPTTVLHLSDPDQQVMDIISSWTLRAGRQIALAERTEFNVRHWVGDFTNLLHQTLVAHLEAHDNTYDRTSDVLFLVSLLKQMITCDDDHGTTMVDTAREVLHILFPETDGDSDDAPQPMGCTVEAEQEGQPEEDEDSDEEGQPESGDDEDSDEGESDEQGSGGEEDQPEADKPGDDGSEGEDSDGDEADEDSEGEGASPSTEDSEGEGGEPDPLAEALAAMEALSKIEEDDEAEDEADSEDMGGTGAGGGSLEAHWREPNKSDRDYQRAAEQFLRGLIEPTESSTRSLTDSPAALVDGAALSAWRASGAVRDPKFFIRTRREVQPSPPVKIAVLVDVSGSMDVLQEPSSILSWAVSTAAIDLQNFAGRGQQVESTLIHWGSQARVIQPVGKPMPGIKVDPCMEGTYAMGEALALVEEQMPGFFDVSEAPVHRLLVHFTDWALYGDNGATDRIKRALESGVNMLSIVPSNYTPRYSSLNQIMDKCKVQRGRSGVVKFKENAPNTVWDEAAEMLR